MFHFAGKLEHLLAPANYFQPEWHEREVAEVFRRSWNFFCLASDVAAPGDRFAAEVYGVPVVVFNRGGELFAVRNVCGHRHSLIVKEGPSCGKVLKCQIHGWEYDHCGRLTGMPDGRHFRVVKAGEFALGSFRVEKSGPFVFVNLASEGPSFRETLGNLAEEFESHYRDHRLVDTWVTEHDVNWKIMVENAVESYHVPMVHPRTFEDYRPEDQHEHLLAPTFTRYRDLLPYDAEKGLVPLGFRLYTKWLIRNPNFRRFTHTHLFPNMMLYYGDIFSGISIIQPLGPERTRYIAHGFVPRAIYGGWLGRIVQDLSMVLYLRMGKKIVGEDIALWPPVQKGLKASPHKGVISAREERVYAFQRYLVDQMNARAGAGNGREDGPSETIVPSNGTTAFCSAETPACPHSP